MTSQKRFNWWYHIPSAMHQGIWRLVIIYNRNNDKDAAKEAVINHFKGSVYPHEVEIHIRKSPTKGNPRRFILTEEVTGRAYTVKRIDLSDEAREHHRRIAAGEVRAPV